METLVELDLGLTFAQHHLADALDDCRVVRVEGERGRVAITVALHPGRPDGLFDKIGDLSADGIVCSTEPDYITFHFGGLPRHGE